MDRTRITAWTTGLLVVALFLPASGASASDLDSCKGRDATIKGTSDGEELKGTPGTDVIAGGGGNDTIRGLGDNDVICGGDGNDIITAGTGADEIYGDADNDVIAPGGVKGDGHADTIDGGAGKDSIHWDKGPIEADLAEGIAIGEGRDAFKDVEGMVGTTANDVLRGDGGPNTIDGGVGNDKIFGGAGNDTLDGGLNDDFVAPGTGDDSVTDNSGVNTLSYKGAPGPVFGGKTYVAEEDDPAGKSPSEWHDTLHGVWETIEGSAFDDSLVAPKFEAKILGNGGDDRLTGSEGTDVLRGGGGDDTIAGGDGNDTISGGSNGEVRNLGARGDVVDYTDADSDIGVDVDLSDGTAFGEGADTLVGIESAIAANEGPSTLRGDGGPNVLEGLRWYDELYGAGGEDTLVGGRETDLLDGGDGRDYMNGGPDADEFHPGGGDDVIVGGEGGTVCSEQLCSGDTVVYTNAPAPIDVRLEDGTAHTGAWGNDLITEVEDVIGSAFADVLVGDSDDNILHGGKGTDSLYGQDGSDGLYGDEESDTASGGNGDDLCEAESKTGCER